MQNRDGICKIKWVSAKAREHIQNRDVISKTMLAFVKSTGNL